jgi:hypothetical protein
MRVQLWTERSWVPFPAPARKVFQLSLTIFVEDNICKDLYLEVFRKFQFLSDKSHKANGIDLFLAKWKNWHPNWHMYGIEPVAEKELFGQKSINWGSTAHWQILRWNVSKSWLQKVDFFENYAIVAMQSDNANFYACKIIKETSGFDFKKTCFSARRCHHPKNSWNIF